MYVRNGEVLRYQLTVPELHIHPHGICVRPEGDTLKEKTFKTLIHQDTALLNFLFPVHQLLNKLSDSHE